MWEKIKDFLLEKVSIPMWIIILVMVALALNVVLVATRII